MAFNIAGLARMGPQGHADAVWSFVADDDDLHTFTYVVDVSSALKTVTIALGLTVPAA